MVPAGAETVMVPWPAVSRLVALKPTVYVTPLALAASDDSARVAALTEPDPMMVYGRLAGAGSLELLKARRLLPVVVVFFAPDTTTLTRSPAAIEPAQEYSVMVALPLAKLDEHICTASPVVMLIPEALLATLKSVPACAA